MNRTLGIFQKVTNLEKELQKLKLEAYFALPKKSRKISLYSEKALLEALKQTREQLWQNRYAKKV